MENLFLQEDKKEIYQILEEHNISLEKYLEEIGSQVSYEKYGLGGECYT